MIPFLIYILVKKYRKSGKAGYRPGVRNFTGVRYRFLLISLVIILIALIPFLSKSQSQRLNYKIVKGSDEIGWLKLDKNISGNKLTLELTSEIKTRMIFLFKVCSKETSSFENGKLIQSTQFRKTNGEVKLNKQTRLAADKYEVIENGEKQKLSITYIGLNLLSLYFQEPTATLFYCDKHECFISITRTNDGGYKVIFPDDNSNVFYYSGGICTRVKIEHTFYTVNIILKP